MDFIAAQAVPLSPAFSEILNSGLLGALLLVSLGVIVYLYRENRACNSARLVDAQTTGRELGQVVEANTRTNAVTAQASENAIRAIGDLAKLQAEQSRMIEAAIRDGENRAARIAERLEDLRRQTEGRPRP